MKITRQLLALLPLFFELGLSSLSAEEKPETKDDFTHRTIPPDSTPHTLTVVNGKISNVNSTSSYPAGKTLSICGDYPPAGQMFDQWIGDISGLADPTLQDASFTMPASEVTLTATYRETPYQAQTFTNNSGDSIPYRLLLPEPLDPTKKYPLVIFFHGAGERGTDNIAVVKWGLHPIYQYLTKNAVEAIVIAPQCPPGQQWVDTPWTLPSHTMPKEPSKNMKLAMELLQEAIEKYPVNKDRIYVTGLSMGGFGAWDILQREPELFAAGLPICGGGDTAEAKQLNDLPIWAFHGSADKTVNPQRSKDMVTAIQAAGGKAQLSILPKGHGVWLFVYREKEYLDWLFEQKKQEADSQEQSAGERPRA